MRAHGVGAHEPRLHRRIQFEPHGARRQICQQVRPGRCRGQGRCSLELTRIQQRANAGCRHRPLCHSERSRRRSRRICRTIRRTSKSRNFNELNTVFRKEFLHQSVVAGGKRVGRFRADISYARAERRGDVAAEQVDIQAHLCLRRIRQVFQEISRESSSRDLVIRPFYDIRHTLTTGADHRETLRIGEAGRVFLHRNDGEIPSPLRGSE